MLFEPLGTRPLIEELLLLDWTRPSPLENRFVPRYKS